MKRKVFLCEDIHQKAYELLMRHFDIVCDINEIDKVEAVIVRNFHVDQVFIDRCTHLKILAIHGTGYDNVDLNYLKEKNIVVFHVPKENALSVAEFVIALMLNLSRKVYLADRLLQSQQVIDTGSRVLEGIEISHKTFGMIGYGNIARKLSAILQNGFAMKVIAYSPSLTVEEANELCIERCQSVEEVFEKANFISIQCSLNEQTKGMIDLEILKHAKKDSFFINTSRGAIVNEHDLYIALKKKIIRAAACDVFMEEPPTKDNPLLTLDNFIATSHIGATTEEALYRVGMKVVKGMIDYFNGKEINNRL